MQQQHHRFKSSHQGQKPVRHASFHEVVEQNKNAHLAKEEPKKMSKYASALAIFACVVTVAVASMTGVSNPLSSAEASQVVLSADSVRMASIAQKADALEHAIERLQNNEVMQQYLIAIDNDPAMNAVYDNLKMKLDDNGVLIRISESNQKKLILAVAGYIGASQEAGRSVEEMEKEFTVDFFNKLSPSGSSTVNAIAAPAAKQIFDGLKKEEIGKIAPELPTRVLSLGFDNSQKELSMS